MEQLLRKWTQRMCLSGRLPEWVLGARSQEACGVGVGQRGQPVLAPVQQLLSIYFSEEAGKVDVAHVFHMREPRA